MSGVQVTLHWKDDDQKPIPPVLVLEMVSPEGDSASQLLEPFAALGLARDLMQLAVAALFETQQGRVLNRDEVADRHRARKEASTP